MIFGEYDDGATVINTNGADPVRTRTTKSAGGHSFTLNTITDYVHTTNQVIRMVVLGHMMIKWIEQ